MPKHDHPPQIWRRTIYGLTPASEAAERAIARIPPGDLVTTDIRRPRNIAHHRKYWALVHRVAEAMDWSEQVAHRVLKVMAGYTQPVELPDGETITIEQSIAFTAMDQEEFDAFYQQAVNAAVRILGVSHEDLAEEVALSF